MRFLTGDAVCTVASYLFSSSILASPTVCIVWINRVWFPSFSWSAEKGKTKWFFPLPVHAWKFGLDGSAAPPRVSLSFSTLGGWIYYSTQYSAYSPDLSRVSRVPPLVQNMFCSNVRQQFLNENLNAVVNLLSIKTFLKKNLNAPRPSEHPPVRGKKCQNV